MLLLVTVSVPSRPVLKPQLIPKLQKSYKITNQTKVKVMVQRIGLLKAHTPTLLLPFCNLPAPGARSEVLLLAQP